MNFNELLSDKKFFADMLLSSCENKSEIDNILCFVRVYSIDIYTVNSNIDFNDIIVSVYADYADINKDDILTASLYFRVRKENSVHNNVSILSYCVEYLNMLDCH